MRTVILVKHAVPQIDPAVPARAWRLAAAGQQGARALAERLATYHLTRIVASAEPKAYETAHIVARGLDVPLTTAADLHEHVRDTAPFLPDRTQFEAMIAQFFVQPHTVVFGSETAAQAEGRFVRAVTATLARYPDDALGIVAHGTVIALLVARFNSIDGFMLWQRLGLPSFAVLALPDFDLLDVVEQVA